MNDSSPSRAGHIWYRWPGPGCPEGRKASPDLFSSSAPYDVAILGAGVVGCALARLLSQYRQRIVVIDRHYDVGEGTSKGNSAIIHTGFDAEPGSLESRLVTSASQQWPAVAARLKIPFKPVSALLLAFTQEQASQLPALRDKARANGVDDVAIVSAAEARRLEPSLSAEAVGGLLIPRESIIDPFTASIAFAEVALGNGVDFLFGATIQDVQLRDGLKFVAADGKLSIPTRFVINACGLGARRLVDRYNGAPMTLNPRRGQFLVYDKQSSHLVSRILLPIPTKQTKGMLVAPSIFGNLLAGPTAEDLPAESVDATETTAEGLASVRASAVHMCPALADQPVIASYAGLRCNCAEGSYWIRFNDGASGIVTMAGIRSTGLTASISLAQYVAEQMAEQCDLPLVKNESAVDERPESRWPGWWRRPFDDPARMADRPDYGSIVCSCENVSRGEILDALELCAGMSTLDGLKRRTRVLTGRCQGFNCCVPTAEIVSRHFSIPLECVTKRGPGSEFVAKSEPQPSMASSAPTRAKQDLKNHYQAIIIGAGPAGIGTAVGLFRAGVENVLLVERASEIGGVPAMYEAKRGSIPTFVLPRRFRIVTGGELVRRLHRELAQTRTGVFLETNVIHVDASSKTITLVNSSVGRQDIVADAVVFACGAREKTSCERGWVFGRRLARQFNTMQLLHLIDGRHALPADRPAIIGSDVIAYAAAAKLKAAGAQSSILCDQRHRPAAKWYERLYFRRWCRPGWQEASGEVSIEGAGQVAVLSNRNQRIACDGLVICGELIPNSELLVPAGLEVGSLDRIPVRRGPHELSAPGCFISGAEIGGFHGADWCFRDGRRTADAVCRFLRASS